MKNFFSSFMMLFVFLFSNAFADDFTKDTVLVDALKANQVKIVVLCNFQGTNNLLDIVTSSRSPGYELTNLGLTMLQDMVPILVSQHISHIYSPSTFRAQQTSNLLGKALNLVASQLSIDSCLAMQNFGSAEGEDYDVYKARFTDMSDMLENTPPNGEAGLSVFKRTHDFLYRLTSLNDQTVLVVTHAFNFCHISKCLTGKFGNIPPPGKYVIYDFSQDQ